MSHIGGNPPTEGASVRIRSLATCLLLVLAGLLVPTVADAATPVAVAHCGAVLTKDAYLATNLTCPGPNGLSIGANVTFDLRHHKLTGPGSAGSSGAGIAILDGFSVKLSNGTVQKWGTGIGFIETGDGPASGSATVTDVSFISNSAGSSGGMSTNLVFNRTRFLNNGTGLAGSWWGSATVSNSTFRGNQYGASIDDSALTLTNSIIDRNQTGVYCYDAYCHLNGNSISNNKIGATNGFIGSFVMTKNLISGNDVGVTSGGYSFVDLSHNAFVRNKTGLDLEDGFGTIYRNSFIGNGVGLASANYSDPFAIATIEQNVAFYNGDGFSITGVGDQLKSNTANKNHRWGISAPNAIDLGGNRAAGNGNNPQCVGIVCR